MSRELAFWNDETIAFIKANFVAVAVPTSVAHSEGPEGEFLRKAGLDKRWVTSSGYMSCVSASGKFLGEQPTDAVLAAFEELPKSQRDPGAVKIQELAPSERVVPSPPAGGMVLNVSARFLNRDKKGALRHAVTADFPGMRNDPEVMRAWAIFLQPNTESMWITAEEWRALFPDAPKVGQRVEVPAAIPMRMARFHLNPKRAMTSEDGVISEADVKEAKMALVVDSVTAESVSLQVEGKVHWGTDFDAAKATSPGGNLESGYETELLGRVDFDRETGAVTRFDVVAPGEVWGRWGDANNKSMYVERPGRAPFGFAFELARGASPTERIPPGGNGKYLEERYGYFSSPD